MKTKNSKKVSEPSKVDKDVLKKTLKLLEENKSILSVVILIYFIDVIFIIGDGMINNPELKEIKGPFEFWEKKSELRERLFN